MKKYFFVFSVCALVLFSGIYFKNSNLIINAQAFNFQVSESSNINSLLMLKKSRKLSEKPLVSFSEEVLYDSKTNKYYYLHNQFSFDLKRDDAYEVFDVGDHQYAVVAYDDNSYDEKIIVITGTPMIHIKTVKEIPNH